MDLKSPSALSRILSCAPGSDDTNVASFLQDAVFNCQAISSLFCIRFIFRNDF